MSEEPAENSQPTAGTERFGSCTLLDALIGRRSRRFAMGMNQAKRHRRRSPSLAFMASL